MPTINNVFFLPPTGWNSIDSDGLEIPDESLLSFERGQHTGADNAAVLTDSNLSLTASARVNFKSINDNDGSETVITANTATTATGILAGGMDNDYDTDDSYRIVMDIDTGDQMNYEKQPIYVANDFLEPEDFTDSAWVKTLVTLPTTGISAPDGTFTAVEVEDGSGAFGDIGQAVTVSTPIGVYSGSVFIKKDAIGRATRFCRVRLGFSGNAAAETSDIDIDTNTGEFNTTLTAGGHANVSNFDDDWWKIQMTMLSTDVLDDTVTLSVFPSVGGSLTWVVSSNPGSITTWGGAVFSHSAGVPFRSANATLGFSERVSVNVKGVPTITGPGAEVSFNSKIRDLTDSKVSTTFVTTVTV